VSINKLLDAFLGGKIPRSSLRGAHDEVYLTLAEKLVVD
jgi:hypothetical protein